MLIPFSNIDIEHEKASSIYPHACTNECLVEHSFGFTVKKGQGHLQTMEEYIHAKSKHALVFQMRMINSPFNQYTKTKLRDKGYQHLDSSFNSKLELKVLTEICLGRRKKESILVEILNEDDSKDLRCAYLLTKSVPRRTNREKWKEASGYRPNLMCEKNQSGSLMKGDLVFFEAADETLMYLMVVTDTLLVDTNIRVYVKAVSGKDNIISVSINKLLSDKGLIVVIPSYLYSIENDCVLFTDIAQVLFQETIDRNSKLSYSDDNWALPQSNFTCDPSVMKESSILTSAGCTQQEI